jgi:hypothetical protein
MTAQAAATLDRTVLPISSRSNPSHALHQGREHPYRPGRRSRPRPARPTWSSLIDDLGFGAHQNVRRSAPRRPMDRQLAKRRAALQQLSHHGALFTDPGGAQVRSQSPHRPTWGSSPNWRPAYPGNTGEVPNASPRWRRCSASTDTAPPRSANGTRPPSGKPACPVRLTAGRRGRASTSSTVSLAARPNQWAPYLHDGVAQGRIPNDPDYYPEHGHGESGGGVAEVPEGHDARQTAFHLLCARRRPCPASCAAGLDRQMERQVRRGWDKLREETLARQTQVGHRAARHQARAQARRHQGLGQALGGRETAPPAGRGVRRHFWNIPTTKSAGSFRRSRILASSTTRSSSTSPATTVPAPRAA